MIQWIHKLGETIFGNDENLIKNDCKYSRKNEKKKQNLAKSLIILIKNGSRKNTCLIVSALICALIGGIFQPVVLLIGGWMTDIFLKNGTKIQNDQFLDSVFILIYYGCGCGIFVFILAFLQGIFIQRGTRGLIDKIRKEYLNAVLQQDSNWLDNNPSGIITNNLNENIEIISDGLGNKLCMLIRGFSMFLSSIIACSFINWQLTFITFTMGPISAFVLHFLSKVNETANEEMMENSAKTNSIFEESILNIRTVQACNGQQFMISKLSKINEIMKKLYMKTTFWAGFFDGLSLFVVYLITGISLLFGCRLYFEGEIKNAGDVILIVNTVCVTGYFLGLLGPHLSSLHQATQSFSILHELIQNCSFIEENQNEKNEKSISGHIIFKNVRFKYSNRDEEILKGLSFEVLPGQTIALVGISGCGKSTSIGLLTKMYRATEGEILIDGQNIDNLNSRKLRKNIGIVQQEPKLFDGTINENIQLGRNIDEQNFQKSLKIANIFEFTSKLKNGIETRLGSGGIQLSGGEKQRICISRALVTSPSILILDEATSALDSQNEQIVNKALSNASIGRTTIIIAHRLSSLKNVDRIFVIDEGITKEIGNHYELMKKGGIYAKLAKRQEIEQNTNKNWERKQEIEVEKLRKSIGTIEPFEGSAATILQEYDVHFVGLSTSNSNSDEAENEKITKNGFFKLIRNAMKHSKMFFLVTFLSIPRSIELFTYGLGLSLAFNTLQKSKENYMTWAILTLAEQAIAGIVVWILHTLLIYFCGWIANETINELKIEIFEKVLNQPISFFDNPNTSPSKCVSKIIKHSHHLFACLDHRAIRLLLFINGTFFALLLAFPFVWELGSLGLIITIILTILTCFFQISAHRAHNQKSFNDKSRQFSIEFIENIRTIKLMAVEHFFQIKFENFMKLAEAYENKIGKLSAINFALNQSYVFASDMILFYFGALLIYHGKYSPDKIFLAFNGAQMSAWGVLYYSSWMPEVIRGSASADHFFSFFYSMSEAKETKLKKPQINGSIKIENVSFSYPSTPNINICDRFSIEVPIGNSIGLVGSSGCGKSTIISLLEKFYSPKSGKIKIDNIDINEIDSYHLHQNIALVGQEPILFNATIYENITIGLENVDINEVIKSCEIANSLNFIKNFPLGFDTIVGEGGGFLSGGQKQRIAIARALVRNPKIILFDEATSALDSESEEAVQNALKLATKDRTSITIAHRLGTIQHCDKIYFISNGKIIESGTHLELLQLNQKYAAFVSAQNI